MHTGAALTELRAELNDDVQWIHEASRRFGLLPSEVWFFAHFHRIHAGKMADLQPVVAVSLSQLLEIVGVAFRFATAEVSEADDTCGTAIAQERMALQECQVKLIPRPHLGTAARRGRGDDL